MSSNIIPGSGFDENTNGVASKEYYSVGRLDKERYLGNKMMGLDALRTCVDGFFTNAHIAKELGSDSVDAMYALILRWRPRLTSTALQLASIYPWRKDTFITIEVQEAVNMFLANPEVTKLQQQNEAADAAPVSLPASIRTLLSVVCEAKKRHPAHDSAVADLLAMCGFEPCHDAAEAYDRLNIPRQQQAQGAAGPSSSSMPAHKLR